MDLVWTQIGMLISPHVPEVKYEFMNYAAWFSHSYAPSSSLLTISSEAVAQDLESFSRHAGRSTITTDDVLLLARRNEDLHGIIKDSIDKEKASKAKSKPRR